jgi:hypothetical protein
MKSDLLDKIWLSGGVVGALVSLHLSMNDIPHYKGSVVPWSFLALIACVVILWLKLISSKIIRLPDLVSALILVVVVAFFTYFVVNSRARAKQALITKSSAQVAGVVIQFHNIRTKGLNGTSFGLSVVYRYSVGGKEYVEEDGIADNTASRAVFAIGKEVAIRYALTEPSVSQLVVQNSNTK